MPARDPDPRGGADPIGARTPLAPHDSPRPPTARPVPTLAESRLLARLLAAPLREDTLLRQGGGHSVVTLEALVARGSVVRLPDGRLSLGPARRDRALGRLMSAIVRSEAG